MTQRNAERAAVMALRTTAVSLCVAVAIGMLCVVCGADFDLVRAIGWLLALSILEMQLKLLSAEIAVVDCSSFPESQQYCGD